MDPTRFHTAMQLLALLPSPQVKTEQQIATRYSGYQLLFAADDGELFYAACVRGVQTAWRFFPTPVEIREQMAAVTEARRRHRERLEYEDRLQLTLEREERENRQRIADLEERARQRREAEPIGPTPDLCGLDERERATAIVSFAEGYLRRARKRLGEDAPTEPEHA